MACFLIQWTLEGRVPIARTPKRAIGQYGEGLQYDSFVRFRCVSKARFKDYFHYWWCNSCLWQITHVQLICSRSRVTLQCFFRNQPQSSQFTLLTERKLRQMHHCCAFSMPLASNCLHCPHTVPHPVLPEHQPFSVAQKHEIHAVGRLCHHQCLVLSPGS